LHDSAFRELILLSHVGEVSPSLPLVLSGVVNIIVNSSTIKARVEHLAREFLEVVKSAFANVLEVLVKLLSALSVTGDADGPDAGVDEAVVNSLSNYLLVCFLAEVIIFERLKQDSHVSQAAHYQVLVDSRSSLVYFADTDEV
jgi:hypothetical protein